MSRISGRPMSCPFCHLGFLFRQDLVAHVSSCSSEDMQRKISTLEPANFSGAKLEESIKDIIPVMAFIHEFEHTGSKDKEFMYVCTACYSHGFGPLVPDQCLECGGENIEDAILYIKKMLDE